MPPHCDSLDGPVDLVLPYVKADGEAEIRIAFSLAEAARVLGPDAREVADLHFFETVVRVHRRGEGAPYTGLKPAGLDVGPVIPLAERSIATGDGEELARFLADAVHHEVKRRLDHVLALTPAAAATVPEVREHVEAMLGLQVWAHGVHKTLTADPHAHAGEHHD